MGPRGKEGLISWPFLPFKPLYLVKMGQIYVSSRDIHIDYRVIQTIKMKLIFL